MSRATSSRRLEILAIRRGEKGFALLEILVAFVILALGLGAISTGIAIAMRSDGRMQASRAALRIAQSRLEAAGIAEPLVPGHREGRVGSRYRWQETITPLRVEAGPAGPRGSKDEPAKTNPDIVPVWVAIAVQGADGSVAGLSGLKLAHEPKP